MYLVQWVVAMLFDIACWAFVCTISHAFMLADIGCFDTGSPKSRVPASTKSSHQGSIFVHQHSRAWGNGTLKLSIFLLVVFPLSEDRSLRIELANDISGGLQCPHSWVNLTSYICEFVYPDCLKLSSNARAKQDILFVAFVKGDVFFVWVCAFLPLYSKDPMEHPGFSAKHLWILFFHWPFSTQKWAGVPSVPFFQHRPVAV